MIISVHITHRSADMECLELIGRHDAHSLLLALSVVNGVRESFVLRTCNRVEMYVVTDDDDLTRPGLDRLVARFIPFDMQSNFVQYRTDRDSIRHLFRVSAGLESLIVGEDQIQSQVKQAFSLALEAGLIGPRLSLVLRRAISTGKKVRTDTRLNKGAVSVGSAAVAMAETLLGDLSGRSILILGAGEMATLIAKHLAGKGVQTVFFSNRTYDRAKELAFQLNGKAVRLDSLYDYLPRTDILLVATSSNHKLVGVEDVKMAMSSRDPDRSLVIIDVSFPRNVDPDVAAIDGVRLYDMEGLEMVAQENIMRRTMEIKEAEVIIMEELERLECRFHELMAEDVISALHLRAKDIKDREVTRAITRLNGENVDQVIRDFADRLTAQLLAEPTEALKQASRDDKCNVLDVAKELFGVDDGHVP